MGQAIHSLYIRQVVISQFVGGMECGSDVNHPSVGHRVLCLCSGPSPDLSLLLLSQILLLCP